MSEWKCVRCGGELNTGGMCEKCMHLPPTTLTGWRKTIRSPVQGRFACLRGHTVIAIDHTKSTDGGAIPYVDLSGFFCPVCLGKIVDGLNGDDSRVLSPEQQTQSEQSQ